MIFVTLGNTTSKSHNKIRILSQYTISLQASVGSKILARSDIKALRKDVTAKLYGGDLTRKMKLLKHQAEGKAKMKAVGKVRVPKKAYVSLLKHI